jgi:hypothetical protein
LFEFSLRGARDAATAGRIGDWVDAFLRNATLGANLPMADGLRKERRWWIGPVRIPLSSLTRICGPEVGMPYRTTPAAWEARVSAIVAAATDPETLPPLILEYRAGSLAVCDGNHRYEALRRLGATTAWSVVWCNTRSAFTTARRELVASRSLK